MDIEGLSTPINTKNQLHDWLRECIRKVVEDIFFIQERVGYNWETFRMYKIRNMVKWADHMRPAAVLAWNKDYDDPRIIKSRKWMRKTWIDETPQIVNIMKWDMSFFWARPEPTYVYEIFNDWLKERFNKYKPWIFWWYAFFDKWKWFRDKSGEYRPRTNRENQDVYLRLRHIQEKKWKSNMLRFNMYVFAENIKAIVKWVNR